MSFALSDHGRTLAGKLPSLIKTRDFFFHDGRLLRHLRLTVRTQVALVAALIAFVATASLLGSRAVASDSGEVAVLEAKLAAMQTKVATIKTVADARADRVEQRQRFLAAVLSGKGDPEEIAALIEPMPAARVAGVTASFDRIEQRQDKLALAAADKADVAYAQAVRKLRGLGVPAQRLVRGQRLAMGGPFEAAPPAKPGAAADEIDDAMVEADNGFRALFRSWKKLDALQDGAIAIPSLKPVTNLTLTSSFGVRSDPFRGTRAMHAGLDIPGPVGTPIYATADGVVGRSGRYGAYGNLVEVNHGKGIQTRYGHLSRIMVGPNVRVKRGQLIALMGSTGRSTGPHLHYEIRVDGRAINPTPFLQTTDYLLAMQAKPGLTRVAQGGPAN